MLAVLSNPIRTSCNHLFCYDCARTWFEGANTCPSCRHVLYGMSEESTPGVAPLSRESCARLNIILASLAHRADAEASTFDNINETLLVDTVAFMLSADLEALRPANYSEPAVVDYEILTGTTVGIMVSMLNRHACWESPQWNVYSRAWTEVMQSFCQTIWRMRGMEGVDGGNLATNILAGWHEGRGEGVYPEYPAGHRGKTFREQVYFLVDVVVNVACRYLH